MKSSLRLFVAALAVAALSAFNSADAQIKVGPKVGIDVNSLHFNSELFDSNNRCGFVGGVMAEFTVPVIGVGADLSCLYVRRNARFMEANGYSASNNRDYIDIPLNLKYKFNIPAVNHVIRPFLTTGPAVAFMTGHKTIFDAQGNPIGSNKSTDWAWNFGLGLELMSRVQVAASYGLGLTKAVDKIWDTDYAGIDGKNRYWTITLAYLF